ncbi:molybdenum cofactor guanylyltransferase [Xanthovirga aplysinae]|uniref:molybdenum cofactor guanylyltransferase n=1 Tax=Xanthovirga aplysinae TaxID=2529853 RepID=UPI0012BCB9F7|nr:molybdenum cofactor guanylyltransferase [Xanthovirga aplysinae]MTI33485.1 molybdenum cofactor guanylyltransferase [Xanthovirga aplysinae]
MAKVVPNAMGKDMEGKTNDRELTGIILAGGRSSRMGKDKALLSLNGKLFMEYIIEAIESLTSNIIIIGQEEEYEQFGYPVYSDLIPGRGPLGGIYTGLYYSANSSNLILSCDIPCVTSDLLKYLFNKAYGYRVTVCSHQQKIEPLIGVYQKTCLPLLKDMLETNQLRLRDALKKLDAHYLHIGEHLSFYKKDLFKNINTPQEHESLKKLFQNDCEI